MPYRSASIGCRSCVGGLLVLGLCPTLLAHQDDPKLKDMAPKYEGPGYRAGIDGAQDMGFPSSGITLEAWLPIGEFEGFHDNANDCWGYVSPSGREYALLGLWGGTGVVEITDPANPVIVDTVLSDAQSLWGDLKVYGDYAYKVTESSAVGIQVIDLSDVDNGNVTAVGEIGNGSGQSHNVVIDEDSGYLYRVGGHFYGMGVYDLNVSAVNPPLVGEWSDHYIHDAQVVTYTEGPYAGREIMFACGGSNGGWTETGLAVIDVTDKSDIFLVSRTYYPNNVYSHQGWLSTDRTKFYLNDELDEGTFGTPTTTRVIDVTDIENPVLLPTYTNGNTSIDHNLYVRDDYVFAANYTSGLRVFDVSDTPVEVAYFDVWPDTDEPAYSGLWSNYPLFPSGTVIASDRQQGLWVFTVDVLQGGCYDLDGSGVVDFGDILAVLGAWGQNDVPEDIDGSGTVDFGDILLLLGGWGDVCP